MSSERVPLRTPQGGGAAQDCAIARCRGPPLSTNVFLVTDHEEGTTMTLHYPNPGLEAELAYRREVLQALGRGNRRSPWLRRRRRPS